MLSKRLAKLYHQINREFLKTTTLHGFRVLLRQAPQHYGKTAWIVFLTVTILWTHYFIINLLIEFLDQPTEIHMSPYLIHISNTPFPCIAICPGSLMSKKKVTALAENLFQHQQQQFPNLLTSNAHEMYQQLLLLGNLYVLPYQKTQYDEAKLKKLHALLQSMYNTSEYSTQTILRDLAPDCTSLIQTGFLFGSPANISRIFHARLTRYGVCCMFNYRRVSAAEDPILRAFNNKHVMEAREMRFESSSSLNGLSFVLENDPEDFAIQQYDNNAVQLYVFHPYDYAMPTSTTKGSLFIDRGLMFDMPIEPINFHASQSTRAFSPEKRKCYFPKEGQKFLNLSYYSMDECILVCEMKAMLKYCGCVAPSLSPSLINAQKCTLVDLPCLQQWKRKWMDTDYFDYVNATDIDDSNVAKDKLAICKGCYPNCDGVVYSLYPTAAPLRQKFGDTYTWGLLKGKRGDKHLAIVKLFFKSLFEQETEEDVVGDWVVFLNRFGGILSLIFGFGIMSYIEVLYFYTGKWGVLIYRSMKSLANQKQEYPIKVDNVDQRLEDPLQYTLYWRELNPQCLKQKYKSQEHKKAIQ